MSLRKLMRRPPPRVFAQKQLADLRGGSRTWIQSPESLNSIEVADSLAVFAGRIKPTGTFKEDALIISSESSIASLLVRTHQLLQSMDPVLIVRIFNYLQDITTAHISANQYQEMLNGCIPRLNEFTVQQLVRLMFSVSTVSRRLAFDLRTFSDVCFAHLDLTKLGESTPPRLVSKLVVSVALLSDSNTLSPLLPELERIVSVTLSSLQVDQLQQVSFGFCRMKCSNDDLIQKLITHGLTVTPTSEMKTYNALLISLHRLGPNNLPQWKAFKKIYMDHIGLTPAEPHISELAKCLPNESEILLRRIRTALVHYL